MLSARLDNQHHRLEEVGIPQLRASDQKMTSKCRRHAGRLGAPDALLVCSRHEAERIKHLVAKVPAELQ